MKRAAKTAERRTIAEIKRVIVGKFAPEQLLLFGSRAKGTASADSDYDFAVIVADGQDPWRLMIDIRMALLGLRVPIDVLVFESSRWESWSNCNVTTEHAIRSSAKELYRATA